MAASLKEIQERLDSQYPFAWAVPEDRVGLQLGNPDSLIEVILVALEASEAVVDEAQSIGAQLLLTHHPLLYRPISEIREDRAAGRILTDLIRSNIAVVSCHTNLDLAPGGLNDFLANILELQEVQVLGDVRRDPWCKLTTLVPLGYEDRVRQALFDDRVGVIGAYSHCSYAGRGQGTFRPGEGARPFRGEIAVVSRAEESRLEVLTPESRVSATVARLKAAHPYEEVAYDIYPLHNPGLSLGFGRIGRWRQPLPAEEAAARVKEIFGVKALKVWGRPPAQLEQVAVAGGSVGDLIPLALSQEADIFVTGEVRHHQAVPTGTEGFAIFEVGHFASEVVFMPEWARQLKELFQIHQLSVEVLVSQMETPPYVYL